MKTLSKISKVIMVSACFSVSVFAQDKNPIEELKQEVAALKSQRLQKLDSLEKLEASRWNARYAQQADLKVLTDRSRKLESIYVECRKS